MTDWGDGTCEWETGEKKSELEWKEGGCANVPEAWNEVRCWDMDGLHEGRR